ncbi:hypothetical protein B9Q03_01585 [Candidatus Marsarchaeota G2 archaeon OSP_D]|jgi:hypothetical protein|uniref:Uncharacterized protein n=6 Tax=Candidatus Marsarchaeota group 2 TaxID=2203771 RepID=A0A2R6CB17_9ARCH|nr:MAG: hypothetical protein B9Q08_04235 [Candidatus Marsarchaeota G2 archaeon ECH_B_SAG-M15]PSN92243.1 MAG: hypothetical protein B9Q03_01585 [Candidatus Marsarchaeota G2 archaeon OSP_D]PSN94801.1 MAG: hypothetical protein B9Q06_07975 [Candidatus Marsarchaeota G2 archaeon ECH_B_2]PSN99262.1 MAG: hypothetical protein B9Q07_07450 [Candidatus Marsarchaeota G2 archaeon ECH_B_3]PSO01555.1 MAG: hypothetical protein B9Q05_08445 [Candidatus Marsarchaeota G2 archaeon ECH_B_1]PSO08020.1 MAG: hypothetica
MRVPMDSRGQASKATLLFTALIIVIGLGLAGYAVNRQVIQPAASTVGYPPAGTIVVPNQTSVELFYTSGSGFMMNSSAPINVFILVNKPGTFQSVYQYTELSVSKMSVTYPLTGEVYIVLSNPWTYNVTVTYSQ